jgi:hypothetical protein
MQIKAIEKDALMAGGPHRGARPNPLDATGPPIHTVDYKSFVPSKFGELATKFAPHKALNFIA